MHRGARFYRSDFQIHSPRDAQWNGKRPVTAAERIAFAESFVARCRAIGLEAIAITDHHDICFIKYVQIAAEGLPLDGLDLGSFSPDPSKQVPIVFPGVELTLRLPCQAIVLLDANAPFSLHEALLHALGIIPVHPEEAETGPAVVRLPYQTMRELDERLSENGALKGRYIVLPNLNDGGQSTLLRNGFHDQYVQMPCVGGYTEQDIAAFGSGHSNKLAGGDPNYGSKAVGMFQTSDSRREDFAHLGCRTTWVKIAEPTTEALRQACLSRESRLFQSAPTLPRRYITRVEVTNSLYLGAVDLHLHPQFNALIGGRGTGKSSFLEYIRWAMRDQPVDEWSESGIDKNRTHFLETLTGAGGTVRIHWVVDGTPHVVSFDPSQTHLGLKVGADAEKRVTEQEVLSLLSIRAYSQKQLSSVSGKRAELQRFVEEPIRLSLRDYDHEFETERSRLRIHYTNRRRRQELESQLQVQQTQLSSIQERIRTIQSGLSNLPADAEAAIEQDSARLQEKGFIGSLRDKVAGIGKALDAFSAACEMPAWQSTVAPDSPQHGLIVAIEDGLKGQVRLLISRIEQAKGDFIEGCAGVDPLIARWSENHDRHNTVIADAQAQQQENAAALAQLKVLREDESIVAAEMKRLEKEIANTPDGEAELPATWDRWQALHRDRTALLAGECQTLSDTSSGRLEIELEPGGDLGTIMTALEAKLQGARIHPHRWDALKSWLVEDGQMVERWIALCKELLALIEAPGPAGGSTTSPMTLPSWDLTEGMRSGIRHILSFDGWLELATLVIRDVPIFYYTGGGTRIVFEHASAGQQATVLLTLLLKDSGGPLIIDQPEDDLDSEVVGELIKDLMQSKQHRQMIFASHNANLVVNGDAELVVIFKSVMEDGRSRGIVAQQGAIDHPEVRETIATVMEGGRKAFELRRQKYGF